MTTRRFEIKRGKTWETVSTQEGDAALHSLATELAAKYVGKASFVRSISRANNFDGTQTYTVAYSSECGGGRAVYVTDIY